MHKFEIWFYILGSVSIAVLANSIGIIWATDKGGKFSLWLLLLVLISPLVFISFGLTASKLGGLSMGSAIIDSILTISTILVGLVLFKEWGNVSLYQLVGMSFAVCGIILMQLSK
jgi:multidrug transporter EmrE-like cation transporter